MVSGNCVGGSLSFHFYFLFPGLVLLMQPIPLPSHIHYEMLLQILERQTAQAVQGNSKQQEQVHELIVMLRKALSQQKFLEEGCERAGLSVDYRWASNEQDGTVPVGKLCHPAS
jgi:hypothetical protein